LDSKSVNPTPRYLIFSDSTPAKLSFRGKIEKFKKIKISPVFGRKQLIMMKNDQNNNFILKTGDILNF
jgi:hypothetical protein